MEPDSQPEVISKAEHEKAVKDLTAKYQAADTRANTAETMLCEHAIEKAAAAAGCKHPHVMVEALRSKVRMIDGVPRYIEQKKAENGQMVELDWPLDDGIKPYYDDPTLAALFGREQHDLTPSGKIDPSKLTQDQYMQLRATPEGRKALGLG